MGGYIDRDELLELYANTDELDISNYDVKVAVIRQNILDMPTIDLVRCEECKHLEVINKAPIYAHCHKWSYDFELWQEDTRTNFCSWGERRADERIHL